VRLRVLISDVLNAIQKKCKIEGAYSVKSRSHLRVDFHTSLRDLSTLSRYCPYQKGHHRLWHYFWDVQTRDWFIKNFKK